MLDQYPAAEAWLSQFSALDQQIGRQLLRTLRLISSSDFERHLDETLDALMDDLGDQMVSLFSVPELVSEIRRTRDPGRTLRQAGSSSDRIRHYLENFVRVRSKRARAHQTIESMRAERIHNIVLVEDFIGSGTRISSFLRKQLHPSIRSWISYGWVKLWIVAYGGLIDGRSTIRSCGYKLSEQSFRFVVPPTYGAAHFTYPMVEFCRRNAWRTNRSKIPLGFNNGGTNLVFEHGCPNNAPVVLWSPGKKYQRRGEKFQPLFPNRGIPAALRQEFGAPTPEVAPEVLWNDGQYRLALALLRERNVGRKSGLWPLLVALGLASRTRWDDASVADAIGKPILMVQRLRELAVSLGALDSGTAQLTTFGRTLLNLIRAAAVDPVKQTSKRCSPLTALYYPSSCEGQTQY